MYNIQLAEKIRTRLKKSKGIMEKKMFGGLCFLVNGNMACGVERNNLVVRVGPADYDAALKEPHARPMDFTGRPLRGFVYVTEPGYKTASRLEKWIGRGVRFARSLPAKT